MHGTSARPEPAAGLAPAQRLRDLERWLDLELERGCPELFTSASAAWIEKAFAPFRIPRGLCAWFDLIEDLDRDSADQRLAGLCPPPGHGTSQECAWIEHQRAIERVSNGGLLSTRRPRECEHLREGLKVKPRAFPCLASELERTAREWRVALLVSDAGGWSDSLHAVEGKPWVATGRRVPLASLPSRVAEEPLLRGAMELLCGYQVVRGGLKHLPTDGLPEYQLKQLHYELASIAGALEMGVARGALSLDLLEFARCLLEHDLRALDDGTPEGEEAALAFTVGTGSGHVDPAGVSAVAERPCKALDPIPETDKLCEEIVYLLLQGGPRSSRTICDVLSVRSPYLDLTPRSVRKALKRLVERYRYPVRPIGEGRHRAWAIADEGHLLIPEVYRPPI